MLTSSTPDSKKRRLVLIALTITMSCYVFLNLGLIGLSQWAEKNRGSYPYRSEEWLRYQLSSYFADAGRDDILVVGASAVRENFLTHLIDPTTPESKVLLGTMSQGTLEDTVLGLEYLERVYGAEHVPGTIVFGITARSVAGINNGFSPFQFSLDEYSPYFRPSTENGETKLKEKTLLEGLRGRWRFWFKQPQRYKATLCSTLSYMLGGKNDPQDVFSHMQYMQAMWGLVDLQPERVPESIRVIRKLGFSKSAALWMQLYAMPYKYHHRQPRTAEKIESWMSHPQDFWFQTHRWNFDDNEEHVNQLFQRLLEFTRRNNVKLLVINLPENPLGVGRYQDGNYTRYMQIVRRAVEGTPFLDLHGMLTQDQFHDGIHATAAGATEITERVNRFILQERRETSGKN